MHSSDILHKAMGDQYHNINQYLQLWHLLLTASCGVFLSLCFQVGDIRRVETAASSHLRQHRGWVAIWCSPVFLVMCLTLNLYCYMVCHLSGSLVDPPDWGDD
jgi:hypothetical protein